MKTHEDWDRVAENRLWEYQEATNKISEKLDNKEQELLKTLLVCLFRHGVKDGVEETSDSIMNIMKKK